MKKKVLLGFLAFLLSIFILGIYLYTRHIAFLVPTEEVLFTNGDVVLAGTWIKPTETGRFPAIIVLHGSGPESRNEPTTRTVANTLVRNGFAVLIYDKRGIGASGGDFKAATYREFIDDAIAAVNYVAGRNDVNRSRMGLYAVSESGWFSPEIAARTESIAFIFNVVGSPLSWIDTVAWEVRNDFLNAGVAEEDVQLLVDHKRRQWNYYIAAASDSTYATGAERENLASELVTIRNEIPRADEVLSKDLMPLDLGAYRVRAANISYDPTPILEDIDIPVHYVFGGDDINIPTEESVLVLESLIRDHQKNIDFMVYPGVGHSLATIRGLFNMGFVPGFLENLSEWTSEQIKADVR